MTNFEKIKEMDKQQLAKLLFYFDMVGSVPKKYACNELTCSQCKENYSCYVKWLEREVEE